MATQRKYRGKYPTRIRCMAGTHAQGVYSVELNNGNRYYVSARDMRAARAPEPQLGMDAEEWGAAGLLHPTLDSACHAQAEAGRVLWRWTFNMRPLGTLICAPDANVSILWEVGAGPTYSMGVRQCKAQQVSSELMQLQTTGYKALAVRLEG